ncbi:MAG: hypothetical protein CO002_00190 [Candidatus Portnoybacteria bacterium CG_4_8_14_3_um_filter_44_10]|uniref:t-SNARE coiled-coil homology domain-containing protein n=1 Tax=Candidatus Portnoybacteria bacterium CG_4_8_14_3_um_filter_44_10 TaxID=1974802 RepID=A0A2M7IGX4_9BACT|nr:MAG: hypothetical protein CO002_00190 [Candidatus Portnoybacteria bacterium CG_4_8_14_3_um_filter_44_10]
MNKIDSKKQNRKASEDITLKSIETLLGQQTKVILVAVDEKLARTDKKIEVIDKRMDGLDKKIEVIDKRMDGLDKKIEVIDKRMDGLDKRMDGLDKRIEVLDKRMDGFDRRMDGLDKKIDRVHDDLLAEIRNLAITLEHFLKRLMDFEDEFVVVKARLGKIERILEEKLGVRVE